MTTLFRSLATAASVLGVASLGALAVAPDARPAPAVKSVELKYATTPKPLSDAIKKGLKWLAEHQNTDGGWPQGGGWRSGGQKGGRVEGANVQDPSDVGNTCIAVLALLRAGNTPSTGEYKEHVRKGLQFVCDHVEKSNKDDLYVADIRNTQLQTKIGPFADTFLTTLVLSELKGKAGDDEKRLAAALDKTIRKVAKNQKADGTFAANGGWAPVLSQGVANKALTRARLSGAKVTDEVIARATRQTQAAANGQPLATTAGTPTAPAGGVALRGSAGAPRELSKTPLPSGGVAGSFYAPGDAGVPLYSRSQAAGNFQDVLNSLNYDAEKAKKIVADPKASKEQKDRAAKTIKEAEKLATANSAVQRQLGVQIKDKNFLAGFGSNGGEEFLSFLNISEALVVKAGKEWTSWDGKMQEMIPKAQNQDGSWSGHHCITGKTFCTSAALLVLLADRTQFPADVIKTAREGAKK
jgi:hypothetical protein